MEPGHNSPKAPDILPPLAETGQGVNVENSAESYPQTPESASQPQFTPPSLPATPVGSTTANPVASQAVSNPVQTTTSQAKPSSTEALKRFYADKVRKVMLDNASDPYTESRLIEEIKQQYHRDVYHREIKLPSET